MDIMSVIVGLVIVAIILMIVDRLNLGLSVGGFFNAIIAAVGIAIVSWIVNYVLGAAKISLTTNEPLLNALIYLVVSAFILWLAARLMPGFRTRGFTGAFVAAIAIAVIVWIIATVFPNLALPAYIG